MMRRIVTYGFAALLSPAPALADTCTAPAEMNETALTPADGDGRMLVPVKINGVDKRLLLDTAGGRTTLTAAAAQTLNLSPLRSDPVRLLDDHGNASHSYLNVDSVQVGGLRARRIALMLTPDPDFGIQPPMDGVLAPDLMELYDIDIDFRMRTLRYFSADHCNGRIAFWQGAGIGAVPITVRKRGNDAPRNAPIISTIEMSGYIKGGPGGGGAFADPSYQVNRPSISGIDIRMQVMLDGRDFTANIDTGRADSVLNSDTAKAVFDVTAASPGSTPAGSLRPTDPGDSAAGETVVVTGARVFEHTFHSLSFGDVTVVNPHFLVRPDDVGEKDTANAEQLGSHIFRADDGVAPDITIGMNILKQLHLYFAFKEGRLYVSAASAPATPHS